MNNHANQTSDILMKLKIGGNVKIGPYTNNWRPGTPIPPYNVKVRDDRR